MQGFAQRFDQGLVGLAVLGGCSDRELERAIPFAHQTCFPCARLSPNRHDATLGMIVYGDHGSSPGRPSKRAVPMRDRVAPSSMATSKSLLMPMDNSVHGCLPCTSPRSWSRKRRTSAKVG